MEERRPFFSAGRSQLTSPGPVSCCCEKKQKEKFPIQYITPNVIQQICGAVSPLLHDNLCCVSDFGESYRERRTRGIYCTYTIQIGPVISILLIGSLPFLEW